MNVETLQQTIGTGAAAYLEWDLANEYPDSSLPGEGDAQFSRHVGQLTGGRLRISIRPQCDAEHGLGSRQLFDAVSAGPAILAQYRRQT